jgi:hypothetical protein
MALQNGVDNVDRDIYDVISRDTIRCTVLKREGNDSDLDKVTNLNPCFLHGMVIDDACSREWLEDSVQATRKHLPLNHKRPTVDRRFYCDTTREVICGPIEAIVRHALELTSSSDRFKSTNNNKNAFFVYCNKYLRFLEYNTVGDELLPHRDGIKTCEDTGTKSTHTLLLFLSDCELGGESLIMEDAQGVTSINGNWSKEKNLVLDVYETHDENNIKKNKSHSDIDPTTRKNFNKRRIRYTPNDKKAETVDAAIKAPKTKAFCLRDASIRIIGSCGDDEEDGEGAPPLRHVNVGIQPSVGRILLFPHHWPHAGAMCQSVPKIALRAELTVARG